MNLRRFIFHFMSEPGESLKTSLNRAFSPHSVVPSVLEHHGHASLTPNFNGEREMLSSSPSGESQSLTSDRPPTSGQIHQLVIKKQLNDLLWALMESGSHKPKFYSYNHCMLHMDTVR